MEMLNFAQKKNIRTKVPTFVLFVSKLCFSSSSYYSKKRWQKHLHWGAAPNWNHATKITYPSFSDIFVTFILTTPKTQNFLNGKLLKTPTIIAKKNCSR